MAPHLPRRTRSFVVITVVVSILSLASLSFIVTNSNVQFHLNQNAVLPDRSIYVNDTHDQAHILVSDRNEHEERRLRYKTLWSRSPTAFWSQIDHMISNNKSLYSYKFDVTIVTDILKTVKIERIDVFNERYSLKWLLTVEGGQRILFKPATV